MTEKTRILVVDDEKIITTLLSAFFKMKGWDIETANSTKDALKIFNEKTFDIAFIDIRMPGEMDGYQLIKKLQELGIKTTFIAMTGSALLSGVSKAQELGVALLIKKPFEDLDVLAQIVHKYTSQN